MVEHKGLSSPALKELEHTGYFRSFFSASRMNVPFHVTAMLVGTDLLEKAGGFDEQLLRTQDIELWCRIALQAPEIGYVTRPCVSVIADVAGQLCENGQGARYMFQGLSKILEMSRSAPREIQDDFRAFAEAISFRMLVKVVVGREELTREEMARHTKEFPLPLRERFVLKMLQMCPGWLANRMEGRIRDWQRKRWLRIESRRGLSCRS